MSKMSDLLHQQIASGESLRRGDGPIHGLVETLVFDRQSNSQKNNFPDKMEALCQTLTQSGLTHVAEWNCKVDQFHRISNARQAEDLRADDIEQMFTFTEQTATADADVTFVSVYQGKSLQTGVCRSGMVEFLTTSGIYRLHKNVSIGIQGHVFTMGDLKVKVGSLSVNFPKFLLVQICYEPSVFLRENTFEWQQTQMDELIRFSLRLEQSQLTQLRVRPQVTPEVGRHSQEVGRSKAHTPDITVTERLSLQLVETILFY